MGYVDTTWDVVVTTEGAVFMHTSFASFMICCAHAVAFGGVAGSADVTFGARHQ